MLLVQLGWSGIDATAIRASWQAARSLRPPPLPNLLARQWLLERDAVRGQYVFADRDAARGYIAAPEADPAYALLARALAGRPADAPERALATPHDRVEGATFIIAAPRSCSTLLFDLLAQAPGLWTQGHEGHGAVEGIMALHPSRDGWTGDRLVTDDYAPELQPILYAGWRFGLRDRHGLRWRGPGRPRLLDKTTEHALRVAFLAHACPDARFVLLHRDARANVSSLMCAWQHGGFERLHDLPEGPNPWCFVLPPDWRDLRGRTLQDIATMQWQSSYAYALNDLEALDPSRWTAVDANELLVQPRRVVERLATFLELPVDDHLRAVLARPLPVSATAIGPPSLLKWRSHRELDVARVETTTRGIAARLRSLHALSAGATAARIIAPTAALPIVRFACPLDNVAADGPDAAGETLVVDPTFRLQLGASIPLGLASATRFRDRFLGGHPILWTCDPRTGAHHPFWAERADTASLLLLRPQAPASTCSGSLNERLRSAGILASADDFARRAQEALVERAELAQAFARQGWCVVPDILPRALTAALARYYRTLVAAGGWMEGDAQVVHRRGWHNESIARFFHHQLTGFVGAIAGERVCPSYVYVSAYHQGAELTPHVDRKQCAFTMSRVVDEQHGRSADWPLHFLTDAGPAAITVALGGAVLFRGHDLPHWRETAPNPELALTTLILHYVPADFAETLH